MIKRFLNRINAAYEQWRSSEEGMAAVEAAMVFPLMLTLLLGTFDMGNGILANQKAIRASQVTADLIARSTSVDNTALNDAIEGGELALFPFQTDTYGVDIVSISFDEDANPQIEWRETRNMSPIADPLARVEDIAEANDGILLVVVRYEFVPIFAGFVINEIPMQEIAFARGRGGAVIDRI